MENKKAAFGLLKFRLEECTSQHTLESVRKILTFSESMRETEKSFPVAANPIFENIVKREGVSAKGVFWKRLC